ncbi:MAG: MFS transporter [Thermoplasmata archaeon]
MEEISESAQRRILFVVVVGTLMTAIDSTIMVLALPTVGQDLNANLSTIIWTILIYLLLSAVLTTQFGRTGDIYGRARMFNLGFVIFTIASGAAGFSPNATFLIAFRGIQAIGGSLMFANGGAIIADTFPATRRGRAFGFTTMGWSVGAILGILLGGVITTLVGWRYIFFINVPIGVLAIPLGFSTLKDRIRVPSTIDGGGFALLSASLGMVSYGAIDVASYGLRSLNMALLVVGAALLVPFAWWETRARNPMLNLKLLRDRQLGLSLTSALLQSIGYLSVIFLLTMYLQGVRGLSPLDASLLLVPAYVVSSFLSPAMGRWSDRLGAHVVATWGIALMLAGVLSYAFFSVTTPLFWVVVVSLVTGFGGAMYWPANTAAIMARSQPGTYGAISGLRATLTNVGWLLSFVIALVVASAAIPRYVAFEVFLGTTHLVGGLGAEFLNGLHAALIVSAVILAVAGVVSYSRGRPQPVLQASSDTATSPRLSSGNPTETATEASAAHLR